MNSPLSGARRRALSSLDPLRSRGGRWAIAFAATAALLCIAWASREQWLPGVAHWLNVEERPRACDYVLVLPGGEETRPFVAAALIRAGFAEKILAPKVQATPDTEDRTRKPADEIIRDVVVLRGVPPGSVRLIGQGSVSTYTDALALKGYLETLPPARVAIVTHDYHTRRARWVFRRVLGDGPHEIYFVGAPNDRFEAESWWRCKDGAWSCSSEYGKLALYFVRYGGFTVWCGGLIAAALILAAFRRKIRGSASKRGAEPELNVASSASAAR